jgi:hypothetical protein
MGSYRSAAKSSFLSADRTEGTVAEVVMWQLLPIADYRR